MLNKDYYMSGILWLENAQNANGNGGIPAYYNEKYKNFSASYQETSGYLLVTLSRIKTVLTKSKEDEPASIDKIINGIITFLKDSHNLDGGWGHPGNSEESLYFDTCQIIEGLAHCYKLNQSDKLLELITSTVSFLDKCVSNDGKIFETIHKSKMSYSYQARASSILYEVGEDLDIKSLKEIGERNLKFIVENNLDERNISNVGNLISIQRPITHFLAYAYEGILRYAIKSQNNFLVDKVSHNIYLINKIFMENASLGVSVDKKLKIFGKADLLTGLSQFAIINWILYSKTSDHEFKSVAIQMNSIVKQTVNLTSKDNSIRGAVKSCNPFCRYYYKNCYLNWALKFFLDACILEDMHYSNKK